MQKIFFRADGNQQIGLGHVTRCLALADMVKDQFECCFIIQQPDETLKNIISLTCNYIIELPVTEGNFIPANELEDVINGSEIVVLDGYRYNDEYRSFIKSKDAALVCIDDLHDGYYTADVIINHAPCVSSENYSTSTFTRLCLGTDYTLLRKEFLKVAATQRQINKIDTAFVCFGGSDFFNLTGIVIQALYNVAIIKKINVVAGAAYAYMPQLEEQITLLPNKSITLYKNADAAAMVSIMADSQLGILPASGISLEVMSVGMALILGYYADNQKEILKGCIDLNCCYSAGSYKEQSVETLTSHINEYVYSDAWKSNLTQQKKHFTGESAEKLRKVFTELAFEKEVSIQEASAIHLITYFNWANDPEVRQNAINTEPILLENHQMWFLKKINSPDSKLFIFFYKNEPMGQVRFDKEDGYYLVDYSVDRKYQGKGFGRINLKKAIYELLNEVKEDLNIRALVKVNNVSSAKTFQNLSFTKAANIIIGHEEYHQFTKQVKQLYNESN